MGFLKKKVRRGLNRVLERQHSGTGEEEEPEKWRQRGAGRGRGRVSELW